MRKPRASLKSEMMDVHSGARSLCKEPLNAPDDLIQKDSYASSTPGIRNALPNDTEHSHDDAEHPNAIATSRTRQENKEAGRRLLFPITRQENSTHYMMVGASPNSPHDDDMNQQTFYPSDIATRKPDSNHKTTLSKILIVGDSNKMAAKDPAGADHRVCGESSDDQQHEDLRDMPNTPNTTGPSITAREIWNTASARNGGPDLDRFLSVTSNDGSQITASPDSNDNSTTPTSERSSPLVRIEPDLENFAKECVEFDSDDKADVKFRQ